MNCISCDTKKTDFFLRKNGHDICRCLNCGLLFVWPRGFSTSQLYSKNYFKRIGNGFGFTDYDSEKLASLTTFESILDRLDQYYPRKGKLLDVGAATGVFMKLAKDRSWDVEGLEVSEWAKEEAKKKGLSVVRGKLTNSIFKPESFDVVTMLDVIEHMSEPLDDLIAAHQVLKPGGLVLINTPDTESLAAKTSGKLWPIFVPPEHLFYFNKNNLANLLKKSGFEVLFSGKTKKSLSLSYLLSFFMTKNSGFSNRIITMIVNSHVFKSCLLSLSIWNNLTIIAKK